MTEVLLGHCRHCDAQVIWDGDEVTGGWIHIFDPADPHPAEPMRVDRICECAALPVNRWYRGGQLVTEVTLALGTGERDADAYNGGGYDAWVIACPQCGLVYAEGTQWP